MLPLYAARIEDLGPGDFVKVDCAACHHVALLTPEVLLRVGLSPAAKVLDLKVGYGVGGVGGRGERWFRLGGDAQPCRKANGASIRALRRVRAAHVGSGC